MASWRSTTVLWRWSRRCRRYPQPPYRIPAAGRDRVPRRLEWNSRRERMAGRRRPLSGMPHRYPESGMASMPKRGRRKKGGGREPRGLRTKPRKPIPFGVDFGCLPPNAALTLPHFSTHLREASIVGVSYGHDWSDVLDGSVPSLSLVADRPDPLRKAFSIFSAWSEQADGDAVELTVVLKESGGYLLGISAEYDRLARRCVGFDRSTVSPLAVVPMWCHRINTTHQFLTQFRAYSQKPVAPFLFGGVVRSGLLTGAAASRPPVTPISGLTPILKFEIDILHESAVHPGSVGDSLLRTASSRTPAAEYTPSPPSKRSLMDIGSERARVLHTHFPVTLERLRRSGAIHQLLAAIDHDVSVAPWQMEQAWCNLALSSHSRWGVHYSRLQTQTAMHKIVQAVSTRYESADGRSVDAFTIDEVRTQVLADGRALLRYLNQPIDVTLSELQTHLEALGALHAPSAFDQQATETR